MAIQAKQTHVKLLDIFLFSYRYDPCFSWPPTSPICRQVKRHNARLLFVYLYIILNIASAGAFLRAGHLGRSFRLGCAAFSAGPRCYRIRQAPHCAALVAASLLLLFDYLSKVTGQAVADGGELDVLCRKALGAVGGPANKGHVIYLCITLCSMSATCFVHTHIEVASTSWVGIKGGDYRRMLVRAGGFLYVGRDEYDASNHSTRYEGPSGNNTDI